MNTILAICCQLAILYAYYAPVRGTFQQWSLKEATVNFTHPVSQARFVHHVSLILIDDFYNICADADNDGRIVKILHFRLEEFNSFLDDTIFVITKDQPRMIVRLKFTEQNDAEYVGLLVFATTQKQKYKWLNSYKIVKLGKADELGNVIGEHFTGESKPIYFTVFVGVDQNGDETEKRRFIVHGGSENKQFVVFDENEFNIIPGEADNRFLLAVKSPDNFVELVYYGLILSLVNDSHEEFETYVTQYASSNIIVPLTLYSFADKL